MTRAARSRDWRARLAWLAVPWRDAALLVALVAAAATPAFLVTASDLWRAAAADEIARSLVLDGPPSDAELVVSSPAELRTESVVAADDAVVAELADADTFGPARRTIVVPPSLRDVVRTPADASVRVPIRLVAHDGALEALGVDPAQAVDGPDGALAVWMSAWFAEEYDLAAGDHLRSVECAPGDDSCVPTLPPGGLVVAGLVPNVWQPPGEVAEPAVIPGLDPALVPQFVAPFGLPNHALAVVDATDLRATGFGATVTWRAERTAGIDDLDTLVAAARDVRRVEAGVAQDPGVSTPLAELAAGTGVPRVASTMPERLAATRALIGELDQPFASARIAGVVLGLGAVAAGAGLTVERRRREFRLLAGEGDRWPEFARRAAAQLAAPTALGTIVGVTGAVVAARAELGVGSVARVDLLPVLGVALLAVLVGALVTGVIGQRSLGDRPAVITSETLAAGAVILIAATGLLWFQVGRGGPGDGVDPAVVLLPVAGLATAVAAVLGVISIALRHAGAVADRLPAVGLLLWRRLTDRGLGARTVVAAGAVALGLMLSAGALVDTLDRTLERSLATELGGATRVELIGPLPPGTELPERTTVIALVPTRVSPGDRATTVVLVDPATVREAVLWPDDLAVGLDEALGILDGDAGDDLPAIALDGQTLPSSGAFGLRDVVRYDVVDRVASVPLAAGDSSTLLMSAPRVDAFVAAERERVGAPPTDRPPSRQARQRVVSALPAAEVTAFLDELDVRFRNVVTADQRRADADVVGPRFAFGYLAWLGRVAVAIAATALGFQLASRRAIRALTTVLTVRMGASVRRLALVTAAEVVVLAGLAAFVAVVVAPVLAGRLLPRFDPTPELPPDPMLVWSPLAIAGRLIPAVLAIGVVVWLLEMRSGDRRAAEVLRDAPT